jgi:hypothetical protein
MNPIDNLVKKAMRTRANYLDALIAAVIRENGCKASDLELVEKIGPTECSWTVRKKEIDEPRT